MKFSETTRVCGGDAASMNYEYWFRHYNYIDKLEIHILNKKTGETTVEEIARDDAVEGSPVVEDLLHKVLRQSDDK